MSTLVVETELLDSVRSYAVEIGEDVRLVQGAGGNFSVKVDDVLWIKASGTRLRHARTEQIFLPMRLSQTRAAVLETEDLVRFVVQGARAHLRPSIETSLHSLLPHRVVLHVHSTGAIAAGLDPAVTASAVPLPAWFATTAVPYAKPGVQLARVVLAAIGEHAPMTPRALLLRNHGLVAAADDVTTAASIVSAVQAAFASRSAPPRDRRSPREGWTPLHPAGTVTAGETAMLLRGPYTPDQAVFMGPRPFTLQVEPDSASRAAIGSDGSVWLRHDAGVDEAEIASSAVDVARLTREAEPTPLTDGQVDELIDWEAEKWRRSQRR